MITTSTLTLTLFYEIGADLTKAVSLNGCKGCETVTILVPGEKLTNKNFFKTIYGTFAEAKTTISLCGKAINSKSSISGLLKKRLKPEFIPNEISLFALAKIPGYIRLSVKA